MVRRLVAENPGTTIYVKSVVPELYSDLGVHLVMDVARYRTQAKQQSMMSVSYVNEPAKVDQIINFSYGYKELKRRSILSAMEKAFGFIPSPNLELSIPKLQPEVNEWFDQLADEHGFTNRPIAVVRPVTIRREWECESRAPRPEYIAWVARQLQLSGFFVISIADLVDGEEWLVGEAPPADLQFHHGELSLIQLLTLLRHSNLAVGGSGFIIPAALSAGTPLFTIFGGRGEYDTPAKVFDMRLNLSRVGWALPDNFCRCASMTHDCDKTISDLDHQFFQFLTQFSS